MIDLNKYLKLDSFPEKDRAAFVASLMQIAYARLANIAAEHADEHQLAELEELLKQNNDQAVLNWLERHIPNFQQTLDRIIQEESQEIYLKVQALIDAQPED